MEPQHKVTAYVKVLLCVLNIVICYQSVVISIGEVTTIGDVLISACNKRQLNPSDSYVRLKPRDDHVMFAECNHGNGKRASRCLDVIDFVLPEKLTLLSTLVSCKLPADVRIRQ